MLNQHSEILVDGAAHDGVQYDLSSQTQRAQGEYLLSLIPNVLPDEPRIADIGCGNGKTTLDICRALPEDSVVLASDLSQTQIEVARKNLAVARGEAGAKLPGDVTFYVADALDIGTTPRTSGLDVIFSNAALHWVKDGSVMYGALYQALADDGEIVVQQGGKDCYAGLARVAFEAAEAIGVGQAFEGWEYPLFYPSQDEMSRILTDLGFQNVAVESLESDGSQYPDLYKNYADAGILPFTTQAGEQGEQLREKYLELAGEQQERGVLDTYTHRIIVTAKK